MNLERTDWVRALTAHPAPLLNALATKLTAECEVKLTSLPQAGLGLLTLTDGAFLEPYYLGEFPLSACRLEIGLADGRRADGGAQVLADDAGLARSLAILDAILAARFPGCRVRRPATQRRRPSPKRHPGSDAGRFCLVEQRQ